MSLTRGLNRILTRDLTIATPPFIRNQGGGGGGLPAAPDPTFANVKVVAPNFDGTHSASANNLATPVQSSNWTTGGVVHKNDYAAPEIMATSRLYYVNATAWEGIVQGTPSWDINTQDFCIEGIWEFSDISVDRCLAVVSQTTSSRQWELWWDLSENEIVLDLWELGTGDTPDASLRWPLAASVDTNYEIAVGRDSSGVRCYVNGTQVGVEHANSTDVYYSTGVHLFIGYTNNSQHLIGMTGYVDCFRLTVGEMHITESYATRTATEAYPTS